jgi:hypothetical protein
LRGKTFHDPFKEYYEFCAHVRYYTYPTFIELIRSYGFSLEAVYIALPEENTQYRKMCRKAPLKARLHRTSRWLMYHLLSPRWTAEPIACFQKTSEPKYQRVRKVVL